MGIIGTRIMALSDAQGHFSIALPKSVHAKRLTFQVAGFLTQSYSIDSLLSVENPVISLKEDIQQVKGTVIKGPRLKTRVKGNKGPVIGALRKSFVTSQTLYGYGIVEKAPKKSSTLTSISFNVSNDSLMSFTVRPFIYAIKNNEIDYTKNLVTKNRQYTFSAKKGWLNMDLRDMNIEVSDLIIFGVEWVSIEGDAPILQSSIALTALGRDKSFETAGFHKFERYRDFLGGFAIKGTFEFY